MPNEGVNHTFVTNDPVRINRLTVSHIGILRMKLVARKSSRRYLKVIMIKKHTCTNTHTSTKHYTVLAAGGKLRGGPLLWRRTDTR